MASPSQTRPWRPLGSGPSPLQKPPRSRAVWVGDSLWQFLAGQGGYSTGPCVMALGFYRRCVHEDVGCDDGARRAPRGGLGVPAGQGWLMGHWGKAGTNQSPRDSNWEPQHHDAVIRKYGTLRCKGNKLETVSNFPEADQHILPPGRKIRIQAEKSGRVPNLALKICI